MQRMRIALALAGVTLSGCGNRMFASRVTNPVIEDRVRAGHSTDRRMSIVSTRADRRTIMIFAPNRICPESAPDVGEAVSAQFMAELAARGASAGIGSSSSTAIMSLINRSQGLQQYRDAAFTACIMYVNGALTAQEYREEVRYAFDAAVKLTGQQIEKNNLPNSAATLAAPAPPAVNPDTPQPQPRPKADAVENSPAAPAKQ